MDQEIGLRAAVEDDVEQLAVLSASVQQLHVTARPDVFKTADPRALRHLFMRRLTDPAIRIWIAEIAGIVVGHAVTVDKRQEESLYAHTRSWREVDEVVVGVGHRRIGVARALLRHVEITARTDGFPAVELNTWAFNGDARASFEHLGFVPRNVRYERRIQRA